MPAEIRYARVPFDPDDADLQQQVLALAKKNAIDVFGDQAELMDKLALALWSKDALIPFVAAIERKIIGLTVFTGPQPALYRKGVESFMVAISVADEHRGNGAVATKLMNFAAAHMRSLGATLIYTHLSADHQVDIGNWLKMNAWVPVTVGLEYRGA